MVALAWASLEGCSSVRGASSCGGAGLPLLTIILVLGVLLGSVLVRVLSGAASALSISFLAVAFVAMISGLFLLDALDGAAAVILVPVLTVIGYLASHWVTTHVIETADDPAA